MSHTIQYALVCGEIVLDSQDLTDDQIRERCTLARNTGYPVERFDRCPVCEAWTTFSGYLRVSSECPAVQEAVWSNKYQGNRIRNRVKYTEDKP